MECNICTDTYAVNTGMMCRMCTYRWCDTCEKRMNESGRTRICSQCRVGTENFIQIGVPINVPTTNGITICINEPIVDGPLHYSQCSAWVPPRAGNSIHTGLGLPVQCTNIVLTARSGAVLCAAHR
jgi:hypothetical protein